MTKKEVLRAVDRSIEHWLRDIVMPLELGKCYFVSTVGGAPLAVIKQYVENQKNV